MGTKNYATFDANAAGAHIELELSALVATHSANDNVHRLVRSTQSRSTGHFYVEALFYGDGDIEGNAAVGIVTEDHSLAAFVGEELTGYGYRPGEGGIYNAGTSIEEVQAAEKGDVVGLEVNLTVDDPYVAFYLNGSQISSRIVIGAGDWFVALTVAGDVGYDLRGFVNFGQRVFEGAVPELADAGMFIETVDPALVHVSSEPFVYVDDDDVNRVYDARLLESFDNSVRRSISFWPWGRSGGDPGVGDLDLINNDGAYDFMLSADYRDQAIRARVLDVGQGIDDASPWWTMIVESVTAAGENSIRVRLRDKLSLLDRPMQRRLFLPSASENAANQPWPITLGTARNVPPVPYDEENLGWAVNDRDVRSIIVVRDKGDPYNTEESPPDWTYNEDQSGFYLAFEPEGKITADVSSTGGSGADPTPDLLLSAGAPFVWAGGAVVGFNSVSYSISDGSGGTHTVVEAPNGGARLTRSGGGNPTVVAYLGQTAVLTPGQSYRYRVEIGGYDVAGGAARLLLAGDSGGTTIYARLLGVGSNTGIFEATTANIYLTLSRDTLNKVVDVVEFTVENVDPVNPVDPEDPVEGITFADFAEEVIVNRAGLTVLDWDRASAEAIDTGYSCGIYLSDPTTCRAALDMVIDSYCAGYYQNAAGQIVFGKLEDPDQASDDDVAIAFTRDDIIGDLQIDLDTAAGLSTQMACRRNWTPFSDADFVNDDIDGPPSLRARFMRAFQLNRVSSASLAAAYQHARNAAPVNSMMDDPDDAQAEIDRVCSFYTKPELRWFAKWTVRVTSRNEHLLNPCDIVKLTFPRFGLETGRRMLVTAVEAAFSSGNVTITAWY